MFTYKDAWYGVWDRIKKYDPRLSARGDSGLECVLKWIDDHAKGGETDRIKELQKQNGMKDSAITGLKGDRDRLKRVMELKDIRLETLAEDLRVAREDRDRYREQIGNLLSAIDQWKINSGLY